MLMAGDSWPPQPWLQTVEVARRVEDSWRAGRAVLAWLDRVLAVPVAL